MLGKIQTTIDTPELCIAFVKFLKIIVKLGKSITPTYTNIEGKKETHQLVVYQNTLYIGSDKSLSTNFIEIEYTNIMAKYKRLREQLEEACPDGVSFKFSPNDINKWFKEYETRIKTINIYENGIQFIVYEKRIEKILRISTSDKAYITDINTKLENRFDVDNPLFSINKSILCSEQLNIYDTAVNIPILLGFNIEEDKYSLATRSLEKDKYPIFFRLFRSVFLKNVKTKDADSNMYLFNDTEYDNAYILMHLVENNKYTGYQFFRIH